MFEALLPFFNYCIRNKSNTLKDIALESISFWTYLIQYNKDVYQDLGHFTKDDKTI
jgi:hypothetical protein